MFIKGQGQRYDGYIIAYFVGAPEGLDMKFVHEVIEFQDCNTFTSTIDLFGGFIPWTEEKIPFVTQPDYNMFDILGVNTIVETYHRMPTSCPRSAQLSKFDLGRGLESESRTSLNANAQ